VICFGKLALKIEPKDITTRRDGKMETVEKSGIITCSFFGIRPINFFEEGVELGGYAKFGGYVGYFRYLTNETAPMGLVEGEKNLYLVGFNRSVGETEYISLLKAEGKRPCKNAINYTLGLMAQVPENKMPEKLHNKDIVAAEPNNGSTIFIKNNGNYFLYVPRVNESRIIIITGTSGWWPDYIAFVAEDLVS